MSAFIAWWRRRKPIRSLLLIIFAALSGTSQIVIMTRRGNRVTVFGSKAMRRWVKDRLYL